MVFKDPKDWVKPRASQPAVKRETKRKRGIDPIRKIIQVNNKCFKFHNKMNDLLQRILTRYELDKPILMRDKLDMIWDKKKTEDEPVDEPEKDLTPDEEFERVLREYKMSAAEVHLKQ